MTDVDDFLMHYGVLGMKWGKHKAEDTSARTTAKAEAKQVKRDAKAEKFVAKANAYDVTIKQIDAQSIARGKESYSARHDKAELTKMRDVALKDAQASKDGKLTSTQKKVLIGAAAAALIVGTAVVYSTAQSGELNRLVMKGQAHLAGQSAPAFKKKDMFAKASTPSLVHKLVVPGINSETMYQPGSRSNCRRCTFAYELRRRGYDVVATKTTTASGQNAIGLHNAIGGQKEVRGNLLSGITKIMGEQVRADLGKEKGIKVATPVNDLTHVINAGAKKPIGASAKEIFDTLSKEPNGSRGELGVNWKAGSGHSMAYEIFNGKPVIFDGQTGHMLDTVEKMSKHGLDKISKAGYTRLDNVDLNQDFLMKWAKNAK